MNTLAKRSVSVINLGRMGFMAAYDIQMRYAQQHLEELSKKPYVHSEDTLLLVEHTPVFTVGIRGKNFTKGDEMKLKKTGAEFYKTNRGGPITFHGPGQLVAYPILNLRRFKPSLKWYSCQLEETMIKTLKQLGLDGRTTDKSGVWVGDKQIGTIGLHECRLITTHGLALNCNVDLDWFKHLTLFGQPGDAVTSIAKELKRNMEYKDTIKPFLRCFQNAFECELEFKMFEEEELKSMNLTRLSLGARDFESGKGSAAASQRAEHGVRRMSTHSASNDTENKTVLKSMPMW